MDEAQLIPVPPLLPIQSGRIDDEGQSTQPPDWNVVSEVFRGSAEQIPLIGKYFQHQLQTISEQHTAKEERSDQIISLLMQIIQMQSAHSETLASHTKALDEVKETMATRTSVLADIQSNIALLPMRTVNSLASPNTPLVYPATHPFVSGGPLPRTKHDAIAITGADAAASLLILGTPPAQIPATAPERVAAFHHYMGVL